MDEAIASALVDRLMHHAHVAVTEGESVRLADDLAGQRSRGTPRLKYRKNMAVRGAFS